VHPMDAGGARPDVPEHDAEPLDREAFPESGTTGIDASVPPDVMVYDSVAGGSRPDAPEDD